MWSLLLALQYHPGWAMANDITVLSAGLHIPDTGAMGSGIYDRLSGILNYIFDPKSGTKLLTNKKDCGSVLPKSHMSRSVFVEDLSSYQWTTLDSLDGEASLSLAHGSECKIEYEFDRCPSEGCFILLGNHGTRTFGTSTLKRGIVACGVVYFKNKPFGGLLPTLDKPDSGEMLMGKAMLN